MNETLVYMPCPLCDSARTRPERVVRGYALERCRSCGLVYVNPQLPVDRLVDSYVDRGDTSSLLAFYERVTTQQRLALYDRILSDVEAALPGRGRLLDFGCGAGYFVEKAASRGWNAHGVELGSWAAEAAALRGLNQFHQGSLEDQHFPDGFFDVVSACQVLEHLPSPRTDLAEICRVLRPGGLLYANVPNYRTLPIMLGCDDFELNYPMAHVNYFTPSTLARLMASCGFRVLRTCSFGGLKWENLIGRRTMSDEARAYRGEPPVTDNNGKVSPSPGRQSAVKRILFPVVRQVFYRWAQVGMSLEIFARKP